MSPILRALPLLLLATACSGPNSLAHALRDAREARCATAICFGDDNSAAFEPIIELPIGKTMALSSREDGLGGYFNNNNIDASFNAGVRFWFLDDWVSTSLYISEPVTPAESSLRIKGSEFAHPASSVKRPYPGLALGLFADIVWLGLDYNQLRNGGRDGSMDVNYAPNERIDATYSVTVAFAPVNAFRTGLGTTLSKNKRSEHERNTKNADVFDQQIAGSEEERGTRTASLQLAEQNAAVALARQELVAKEVGALPADAAADVRKVAEEKLAAATRLHEAAALEAAASAAEVAAVEARLLALRAQRSAAAKGEALSAEQDALLQKAEEARKTAVTSRAKVIAQATPIAASGP